MMPASLRHNLGDDKRTPSRIFCERVKEYFETLNPDSSKSNETRREFLEGCRLPTTISADHIRKLQKGILPREDDVFIVSYPKSGTTWTQQIVKLIRNNGIEDGRDIDEALPWIEPMTPVEAEAIPSPRGFKVHVPYHLTPGGDPVNSPAKYIYVYRNPKDALVSSYHFTVKFHPSDISWDDYFQLCIKGEQHYGLIFDHVQGWYSHKDFPNILVISYESLKKNTYQTIEKIALFLEYQLSEDVISKITDQVSFHNMRTNPSCNNAWFDKYRRPGEPFMRKGVIGNWQSLFSPEQSALIDEIVAEKLAPYALTFEYD